MSSAHLHAPWHRGLALLPAFLALVLAVGLAVGLTPSPGLGAVPEARANAFPDLALNLTPDSAKALDLPFGGPTRLSRLPAEALIVVLVSYFCPPCHKEVPRLKDLEQRLRERSLTGRIRLLGLAPGDDQAQVERFLALHGGLPFPLVPDPDLAAHKRLGSPVVPSLYVVASHGNRLRLLSLTQGEFTADPDAFLDAVLRALPAPAGRGPARRAP